MPTHSRLWDEPQKGVLGCHGERTRKTSVKLDMARLPKYISKCQILVAEKYKQYATFGVGEKGTPCACANWLTLQE